MVITFYTIVEEPRVNNQLSVIVCYCTILFMVMHLRILPLQLLLRGNYNKWAELTHQLCPVVHRNHKHDQCWCLLQL